MPKQSLINVNSQDLAETLLRLAKARDEYGGSYDLPSPDALREMVEATLWAGLRREEGRVLSFALAYVEKDEREIAFRDEVRLDDIDEIAKLAPALVRRQSRLGVNTKMRVWGITQTTDLCVKVRALAPGRVVVKYGPENIAVIEAPLLHLGGNLEDCLTMLAESLPDSKPTPLGRTVFSAVALMLIDAVRRHGNGGSVLIVPSYEYDWNGILQPGRLGLAKPGRRYCGLKLEFDKLVTAAKDASGPAISDFEAVIQVDAIKKFLGGQRITEDLWRVVSSVAELSAIDGALVLDCDFALVDFGAKITAKETESYLERQIVGNEVEEKKSATLRGTRHRSAVNFVSASGGSSMAMVASHDGPLSVMEWKRDKDKVLITRHVERFID